MKKQTILHSIQLLSLAMVAAITIIGSAIPALAQDTIEYNQLYDCGEDRQKFKVLSCDGTDEFSWCEVLSVTTLPGLKLSHLRRTITGYINAGCKIKNRPAVKNEPDGNKQPDKDNKNQTTDADQKDDAKQESSGYKVGDRVKASTLFQKGEENYQPCTVTKKINDISYAVRCDPVGEAPFMDYTVRTDFMRPLTDGTLAPTFECSFEKPAGTLTKTSPATAATFKRAIYESNAKLHQFPIGLQFQAFELGKAYKNLLTNNGLMYETAPQNATMYPIKTKYTVCEETSGEYNHLMNYEQKRVCFKDSFGDWNCPATGNFLYLKRIKVPKDQK